MLADVYRHINWKPERYPAQWEYEAGKVLLSTVDIAIRFDMPVSTMRKHLAKFRKENIVLPVKKSKRVRYTEKDFDKIVEAMRVMPTLQISKVPRRKRKSASKWGKGSLEMPPLEKGKL